MSALRRAPSRPGHPTDETNSFAAARRRELLAHWDRLVARGVEPLDQIDWLRAERLRERLGLVGLEGLWALEVVLETPEAVRWKEALRLAPSLTRLLAVEHHIEIDEFKAVEVAYKALTRPEAAYVRVAGTDTRTGRARRVRVQPSAVAVPESGRASPVRRRK